MLRKMFNEGYMMDAACGTWQAALMRALQESSAASLSIKLGGKHAQQSPAADSIEARAQREYKDLLERPRFTSLFLLQQLHRFTALRDMMLDSETDLSKLHAQVLKLGTDALMPTLLQHKESLRGCFEIAWPQTGLPNVKLGDVPDMTIDPTWSSRRPGKVTPKTPHPRAWAFAVGWTAVEADALARLFSLRTATLLMGHEPSGIIRPSISTIDSLRAMAQKGALRIEVDRDRAHAVQKAFEHAKQGEADSLADGVVQEAVAHLQAALTTLERGAVVLEAFAETMSV